MYTLGQKFSDFFLRVSNLQINLFGLLQKFGILKCYQLYAIYTIFKFQCWFVTLQWALRTSLDAKVRCSLRQMIRRHALENKWIVNRIQVGMSQLVMMLEKTIKHLKVVWLWFSGAWYCGGSAALRATHCHSHELFSSPRRHVGPM